MNRTNIYNVTLLLLLVIINSNAFLLPVRTCSSLERVHHRRYDSTSLSSSSRNDENNNAGKKGTEAVRLYFDISVTDQPIGRLIFHIPDTTILPRHTENIIKLCTGANRGIDPRCHYVKCKFQHSPQFVEGMAQYRWAHVLKGRGRNAVGRMDDLVTDDPKLLRDCTHNTYGGVYYGLKYDEIPFSSSSQDDDGQVEEEDGTGVVLTVPLAGPGRGSTSLSIVRVGESPMEWRERLLLNSAVLGWMEPSSIDVLRTMARQTQGPPVVVESGVLE